MNRIIKIVNRMRPKKEYATFGQQESLGPPRLVIFLIIITLGSLGLSGFYSIKYQKLKTASDNADVASEAEAKTLEKKVSRLMVLPEGEVPTIATISNYLQLKDQPFFNNSSDGDKLLIYSQAKIAVLYSPKSDKIINVGPLNLETHAQEATAPTAVPTNQPSSKLPSPSRTK